MKLKYIFVSLIVIVSLFTFSKVHAGFWTFLMANEANNNAIEAKEATEKLDVKIDTELNTLHKELALCQNESKTVTSLKGKLITITLNGLTYKAIVQ